LAHMMSHQARTLQVVRPGVRTSPALLARRNASGALLRGRGLVELNQAEVVLHQEGEALVRKIISGGPAGGPPAPH
jgi:hypothetical protein